MFARVGFTHFLDHLTSGRFFEERFLSPLLFFISSVFLFILFLHFKTFPNSPLKIKVVEKVEERD